MSEIVPEEAPNSHAIEFPSKRGNVRVTLFVEETGWRLLVSRNNSKLGEFPIRGGFTAVDAEFIVLSALKALDAGVAQGHLDDHFGRVRGMYYNKYGPISICIGSRDEFHRSCVLHVETGSFCPVRNGKVVSFKAKVVGARFVRNEKLTTWMFLFRSRSDHAAQILCGQLSQPYEFVYSTDSLPTGMDVEAILAFNDERWEAAGMTTEEVVTYAESCGASLRSIESNGPGLAFRVTNSSIS